MTNSSSQLSTRAKARDIPRGVAWPLLVLILLGGLALRTWNVNFDRGTGSHPDERSTACFYVPSLRLPASWEQFWDPHASPLNPLWDLNTNQRRSFTYGHFPLYVGMAAGHVIEDLAPAAEKLGAPASTVALMQRAASACDGIAVAGRLTIALLDTLTILLLYLLGGLMAGRTLGRVLGLLAAAFYAFAAQAIQLSHFFAMDPASTTFTVLTVLGAVAMLARLRLRAALVTGLGIGLAVASKFSALPLVVVPLVAALLAVWRAWAESNASGTLSSRQLDGRVPFRALLGVLLAWVTAGVAFFVTSPYAVLDWQNFIQATLVEQGAMVRGIADMPFTRQYRNTTPYIYFIQQQLQWGLGWALGLVAVGGTLFAAVQAIRALGRIGVSFVRKTQAAPLVSTALLANLVVWSWVLPYFGLTGAFLAKFNRYMSPLLPFVLLWAAWLIVWLWAWGTRRVGESAPGSAYAEAVAEESRALSDVPDGQVASNGASDGQSAANEGRVGDGARGERRGLARAARGMAVVLAVVGVLGGIFWSLAYVNGVYNREHTWLTASRWMYENIPSGSTILWEVWDDPLPKSIPDEPGMDMYRAG